MKVNKTGELYYEFKDKKWNRVQGQLILDRLLTTVCDVKMSITIQILLSS